MQNIYHSVPIDDDHLQLLEKHKELICKTYKIDND